MHVHELNPWRTLIVLSIFVVTIIIGFFTLPRPLLTYKLDMNQSIDELNKKDALFYPWQLDSFLNKKMDHVVLFDIRDRFVYGQGHIPGAENLSANDLTQENNIERLEKLNEMNVTVVLYGKDQLQANGPWMLFRQVGLNNVKILTGGYQYYIKHKDNLTETKTGTEFQKEIPRYDYAEMASPKDGSVINTSSDKKPVTIRRREKTSAAAGGC